MPVLSYKNVDYLYRALKDLQSKNPKISATTLVEYDAYITVRRLNLADGERLYNLLVTDIGNVGLQRICILLEYYAHGHKFKDRFMGNAWSRHICNVVKYFESQKR